MRCIVSYDISDDKRRRKVVKILSKGAHRIQYSVFEGQLDSQQWHQLWQRLKQVIDPETDSLMLLHLCTGCDPKRRWAGQGRPVEIAASEVL